MKRKIGILMMVTMLTFCLCSCAKKSDYSGEIQVIQNGLQKDMELDSGTIYRKIIVSPTNKSIDNFSSEMILESQSEFTKDGEYINCEKKETQNYNGEILESNFKNGEDGYYIMDGEGNWQLYSEYKTDFMDEQYTYVDLDFQSSDIETMKIEKGDTETTYIFQVSKSYIKSENEELGEGNKVKSVQIECTLDSEGYLAKLSCVREDETTMNEATDILHTEMIIEYTR
ncbi:hypothetical protein [Anaeromicropila populeti]|uniref:Lipoprotein n=1 Tax=Anaeromicropila populeti TaxID=37658 RepID=A0A1I6JSB0_9FIRM|nr:hypothetical protein [Anaeromicropila populeti]SFR81818.1 hypothetical protein SAMN05661086_01942 [Anaeromicropila populeti]